MTKKAIVLRTAGTNCEVETARAFTLAGAEAEILRADVLAAEPARLEGVGVVAFAGGFSYGDDVAAGRVWGLETRTRLGEALASHVDGGGYVLGVCNGFQVLVESGMFEPERAPDERGMALSLNTSTHYECRWVDLEFPESACTWLQGLETMPCPIAHAEGRLLVKGDADLEALRAAGRIAITYAAEDECDYPANPNGSVANIAGTV